jgi:hypothetical protein
MRKMASVVLTAVLLAAYLMIAINFRISASRNRQQAGDVRMVAPADVRRMRHHGIDMFLEDGVTGEKYFIRAGRRCAL